MRTLNINKTKIWYVVPTGSSEVLDINGFKTGEFEYTYSTPVYDYITMYPSNGAIIEQLFGKDSSLDMVALSNSVILTKDTLIFLTAPVSNYDITYDYRVDNIKQSINSYQYGLRSRT